MLTTCHQNTDSSGEGEFYFKEDEPAEDLGFDVPILRYALDCKTCSLRSPPRMMSVPSTMMIL